MVTRLEFNPPAITDRKKINKSLYVGNPQFPSNYAFYAWRYVERPSAQV